MILKRNIRPNIKNLFFCTLLFFFGIVISELIVQSIGFKPWNSDKLSGFKITIEDKDLGWKPIPMRANLVASGKTKFNVEIKKDLTRIVPNTKDSISRNIVILGDSIIWGWGLDDEETLANRLALLNLDYRVVNAAVPGYGILQSILSYLKIEKSYQADILIIPIADYLFARDRADISWTLPIAEKTEISNVSIPYAYLKNGQLSFHPSKNIFWQLPLRNLLALVKIIECTPAAYSSFQRNRVAINIEQGLFDYIRLVLRKPSKLILLQMMPGNIVDSLTPKLENDGYTIAKCIHPDVGTNDWHLPNDKHPKQSVIEWTANCLNNYI